MDHNYTGAPMPPGFYNMDCMKAMKGFPDGFFDLAIVDPPYGDGNLSGGVQSLRGTVQQVPQWNRFGQRFDRYKQTGVQSAGGGVARKGPLPPGPERTGGTWAEKYGKKIIAWDVAPEQSYFNELFRVSRNQIIWGGNYFNLPPTRCFLIWRKPITDTFSMAMAEYAWTSFNANAKVWEGAATGNAKNPRFHPTQKPIALYSWILNLYAKPGMKILDTHVGSASSLIACHRHGLEYWGYEIDPVYYQKASERLEKEKSQISVFDIIEDSGEQMSITPDENGLTPVLY